MIVCMQICTVARHRCTFSNLCRSFTPMAWRTAKIIKPITPRVSQKTSETLTSSIRTLSSRELGVVWAAGGSLVSVCCFREFGLCRISLEISPEVLLGTLSCYRCWLFDLSCFIGLLLFVVCFRVLLVFVSCHPPRRIVWGQSHNHPKQKLDNVFVFTVCFCT